MPHLPASPALARYRVIDMTQVRAGPTCCRQLADWGADVIQVQMPEHMRGDDTLGGQDGSDYQFTHRNKRSVTLDLKQDEGIAALKRDVPKAEVHLLDAGHFALDESAGDIAGLMRHFLTRLPRGAPKAIPHLSGGRGPV